MAVKEFKKSSVKKVYAFETSDGLLHKSLGLAEMHAKKIKKDAHLEMLMSSICDCYNFGRSSKIDLTELKDIIATYKEEIAELCDED